jgi:rsbT co-antagonist protein RsbR
MPVEYPKGAPVMESKSIATPQLDADTRAAIREYWGFYEPHAAAIAAEILPACERIPDFVPVLRAMTPEQMAEQNKRSLALQRAAIVDDQWGPYLTDLRAQGMQYANMGINFASWFEIITAYRECAARRLVSVAREDMQRATTISKGMNRLLDVAMAEIGDAYVAAKEEIIHRQQEAIRELSTPVLRVSDRLLVIPVVGVVDTHRARQLTETLLRAVRDNRARGVVMDITGVPIVDSKVANHLAQACEAARLMGATVVLTGISAAIAETLVTIGAELRGVPTLGSLQDGIEALERRARAEGAAGHGAANGTAANGASTNGTSNGASSSLEV